MTPADRSSEALRQTGELVEMALRRKYFPDEIQRNAETVAKLYPSRSNIEWRAGHRNIFDRGSWLATEDAP